MQDIFLRIFVFIKQRFACNAFYFLFSYSRVSKSIYVTLLKDKVHVTINIISIVTIVVKRKYKAHLCDKYFLEVLKFMLNIIYRHRL